MAAAAGAAAEQRRPFAPAPEILAKTEGTRREFQTIFGKNLRTARLGLGLKQSDVAARTGLPQQYLSLIEAGRQNITLKTMILLAVVVESDLSKMLTGVSDDPTLT